MKTSIRDRSNGIATGSGLGRAGIPALCFLLSGCISDSPPAKRTAHPVIRAGVEHTLMLRADNTLWAWGSNYQGVLGTGGADFDSLPAPVLLPSSQGKIRDFDARFFHSMVLFADGAVWAWGINGHGQLGNGDVNTFEPLPVKVEGLPPVIKIAPGFRHSLALENDSTIWAWGMNSDGQLGDGTLTDSPVPVKTIGLKHIVAIASGGFHNIALAADGHCWTWGWNGTGQLGDSGESKTSPAMVPGISDVKAISPGEFHTLVLKQDGTVWGWGQMRDGYITSSPGQVPGLTKVIAIAASHGQSFALTQDGSVWAWGLNKNGRLGDGTDENRVSPVRVLEDAVSIIAGGYHTLAIKKDGSVWAWGKNYFGELGDGTTVERWSPVPVVLPPNK
jgi:alpha-tubulin suppressor-like RCC1 family protein